MKNLLRIVGNYIRQYWKTGILLAACAGIFHGVFYLYKITPEIVLYADGMCLLLIGIVSIVHFAIFYRKYCELTALKKQETFVLQELPVTASAIEQEYQEILEKLKECYNQDMQGWNQERRNSIDFYTTWVHQIKAPIAAMKLILQAEDTEENHELLGELFQIEQYVNMVLSFYRLEGTETDYVFREVDLDSMIRQVIHKYAGQFIRKGIRLEFQETNQTLLTDEKWFVFLLEQIISNAIKYTMTGSIRIFSENPGGLTIADTGIGIAPEDLPRIFEKGFTGYNGRMDKKATGLGLYLCKKTAERLAVSVSCTSTVGKGSTFYIEAEKEEQLVD